MAKLTRAEFLSELNERIPDNNTRRITPADHRSVEADLAESAVWHDEIGTAATANAEDFAPASHQHAMSDVEGLGSALGQKADKSELEPKAREWASNPEGDEVEDGEFSALHYAARSRAWASTPAGVTVEDGEYSALHYADAARDESQSASASAAAAAYEAGRAEAARDAIVDSDQIYESTAAGLAGTSDEQYFWVVPETVDGSIDLYRNETGSAAPKAKIFNFSFAMKSQNEAWSV